MSYIICNHNGDFVIFKSDSYEYSDWHSTLELALHSMLTKTIYHQSKDIYKNTFTYLSKEEHLTIFEIPTLLPYVDFCQQYPEFLL